MVELRRILLPTLKNNFAIGSLFIVLFPCQEFEDEEEGAIRSRREHSKTSAAADRISTRGF